MNLFGGKAQKGSPSGAGSTCPSCGAPISAGDIFCVNCGTKLAPAAGAPAPSPAAFVAPMAMPPQAGAMPTGDHTVLVGGGSPAPQPAAPAMPGAGFGARGAAPAQAGLGNMVTCPACGQPVPADSDFCINCGTRLTAPAAKPDPAPMTQVATGAPAGMPSFDHTVLTSGGQAQPAAPAAAGATCPACGAPVAAGDAFCINCGSPLQQAAPQQQVTPPPAKPDRPAPQHMTPPAGPQHMSPTPPAPADPYGMPAAAPGGAYIKDEAPITSRPVLALLTREEARNGCSKTIEVDGQAYMVEIPAGVTSETVLDLPGIGYFDTETGERGSVRLSFFID